MSSDVEQAAVELENLTEGLKGQANDAAEPGAVVRTWFVSPDGADTNDGSSLSPFATIKKAINLARPAHTIVVRAGTYRERIVLEGSVRAGTPEAPITLLGEGMPRLRISANENLVQVMLPHWRIEGFELDMRKRFNRAVSFKGNTQGSSLSRCDVHGGTHNAAISIGERAKGVLIESNHIHDFKHQDESQDTHGVVVQATTEDITIRGNHIHDTWGDAVQVLRPDDGDVAKSARVVLIEKNLLESTLENAVDIKTSRHVTVKDNTIRNFKSIGKRSKGDAVVVHYSAEDVIIAGNDISEAGCGISVGGNTEADMRGPLRVMVRDNTVHDIRSERALEARSAIGIRVNKANDVQLLDNTITRTDSFAVRFGGEGSEGPSANVTVMGNTMCSAQLVRLVRKAPGFKMDSNHYAREGRFADEAGGSLDLAEWRKRTGQDANSDQVDCGGAPS
jgi:nitrous oxidase accessory protein NosD